MPDVQLFDKTTKLVDVSLSTDKPIIVHQGGTSSSKTISILQTLYLLGASRPGMLTTVVGQDIPNLKVGAYRDAQNLFKSDEMGSTELRDIIAYHHKGDRKIGLVNGSEYEFNSYDDSQDARSGKRDYLFVNEANGVSYEIFEELQVRTTKKTFIDFNPTYPFWAHERLKGRDDVLWVKSNYQNNPFIPKRILQKIKGYEPTPENIARGSANEYRWQVYGLGETGRLEGLVFENFDTTTDWPEQYKWRVFGLDFGFTNDPTALIEVRYAHGKLYWKEHIYEVGLTNTSDNESRQPSINGRLNSIGFDKGQRITADSAEPKSIKELRGKGWHVVGAEKGQDSVIHGINNIQSYPIRIHHKSSNLIEEFNSYTWKKDRDGNAENKPIDKFNHGIDAGRYALEKQLNNNFWVV